MRESTLANGVRVLTEGIDGVRSAAVGVWIRQGSAHEEARTEGASHLLEHLVFKGTERRSPRELVLELESLGGSIDAYTSREHTSFQARVLADHLPIALDVLSDLVLSPRLRATDLDLERQVVLEEIATVEDTPDDLVFEVHGERLWGGHPYGRSILGSRETVEALDADTLRSIWRRAYAGRNLIVAAAGHVDHDAVVSEVGRLFRDVPEGEVAPAIAAPGAPQHGEHRIGRDTAQSHLVFGTITPGIGHPLRYALIMLSAAFGGGMSSRLFQKIREELALGYSVYSYQSFHSRAGVTGVYLGTRPGWEDRAVAAIRDEYRVLAREGLPAEELDQIKQQVKGQLMLSLESTGARLYRLAGFALHDLPYRTLDDVLARLNAVTREDVQAAAEAYFDPERQLLVTLGP